MWRIAQAQFDPLAFVQLWATWRADAARPALVHVLAHARSAPQANALLPTHSTPADQQDLIRQLSAQCWGLLPGIHRLRFEQGQVCLTLCVGDAPEYATLLQAHPTGPCVAPQNLPLAAQRHVTIIGAGISGAGTARALATRGWHVTVLDAGAAPAAGASGLPVGVIAPHTSLDDSIISRLSRAGIRAMRQAMHDLLQEGVDWFPSGVQEHRLPGKTRQGGVPASWLQEDADAARAWTCDAAQHPASVHANTMQHANTLWHASGAWLKPARLVEALLTHPNIRWQGHARVDALHHVSHSNQWQVLQGNTVLAQSSRVVIACGPGSVALIASATSDGSAPPIRPLRGQVSWGLHTDTPNAPLPPTPVNGHGSFVHHVPTQEGPAWFAGATYDRLNDQAEVLAADHAENLARLAALLPDTARALAPSFATSARGWAGVRCSVSDRFPMVGAVPQAPEGLWLNSAMGSRGLTLGLLCGEILAAQWHGEPLPVEARLAKALDATRFARH
jgi:tRNA 5-methylaminomethyl-2-thiouridine biosynthesis bifunctional protein